MWRHLFWSSWPAQLLSRTYCCDNLFQQIVIYVEVPRSVLPYYSPIYYIVVADESPGSKRICFIRSLSVCVPNSISIRPAVFTWWATNTHPYIQTSNYINNQTIAFIIMFIIYIIGNVIDGLTVKLLLWLVYLITIISAHFHSVTALCN